MKEIDCKTFPFYQLLHYFILIWFFVRVSLCLTVDIDPAGQWRSSPYQKSPRVLFLEYLHDYISHSVNSLVSYHQQDASSVLTLSNFIFSLQASVAVI